MKNFAMKSALILAAVAATPASAATVLFSEDFDSITTNQLGLTSTAASMTVEGNVDAVVPANGFGIVAPSTVIDLDGTPGPGGVGKDGFQLTSGQLYKLSFVVGGAQRGQISDNLRVSLLSDIANSIEMVGGSGLFSFITSASLPGIFNAEIAGNQAFATSSLTFLAKNSTQFGFTIGSSSTDNQGPLLDSVMFSAVPEPGTWLLMILGLGAVGFAMRRRQKVGVRFQFA